MKNWNAPALEELEVKLTASGYNPANAEYEGDGWNPSTATHNSDTHEWVETGTSLGGVIDGCVQLIDPSKNGVS